MQRKDGRQLGKEAQADLRIRVVEYWQKSQNMLQTAQTFNIPYVTVRKWVSKTKSSGLESLRSDERGRPPGKELRPAQERWLIRKITDKTPEQLKLRYGLWTRETIGELIYRRYGIRRSVWQIGRYLKEWGFTPQKPAYKAREQNSEWVNTWLEEIYPAIKRKAKLERAAIFWGDETGIRSNDNRGRSYSPKGQTPEVIKTGKRFGLTMISAVNNRGKLFFMFHQRGVSSAIFIEFMKRLCRSRKEKIYLIVDNLAVHKTGKVKDWLAANKNKIHVYYLPAYSPELNPDEYLNQDLKANITGKIRLNSEDDLMAGARKFMNKRKKQPQQIRKYFHHPKVCYAA